MKRVREVTEGAGPGVLAGAAVAVAFGGVLVFLGVLIASMKPAADAHAPAVVNIAGIAPGERRTVVVPGRNPLFIVHRTPEQIALVRADDEAPLPSPEPDTQRVQRAGWLVVEGKTDWGWQLYPGGKYDGWIEIQTGTHYDLSGRVREGWRNTRNFPVPRYYFLDDTTLVIE